MGAFLEVYWLLCACIWRTMLVELSQLDGLPVEYALHYPFWGRYESR